MENTHPPCIYTSSLTAPTLVNRCHSCKVGVQSPTLIKTEYGSFSMPSSTRQMIGLVACAFLVIGVFLPILSVPILGGLNYFQNGHGNGTIILVLAGISVVCLLLKRYQFLWLSSTGALGVLLFTFLSIHFRFEQMRSEFDKEMEGNPFAGLGSLAMQSVQLQWGWAVLLVGASVLLGTAAWDTQPEARRLIRAKLVVVTGILVLVAGGAYLISKPQAGATLAQARRILNRENKHPMKRKPICQT